MDSSFPILPAGDDRPHLTRFMVCLAGARDVTVASGTKVVPAGHSAATAHWSPTCYRASAARRIGK